MALRHTSVWGLYGVYRVLLQKIGQGCTAAYLPDARDLGVCKGDLQLLGERLVERKEVEQPVVPRQVPTRGRWQGSSRSMHRGCTSRATTASYTGTMLAA